jgi:AraC family transcriptional regulator, regulatory protein of adaptative response / DNA-3-methyladenine glycosylase II
MRLVGAGADGDAGPVGEVMAVVTTGIYCVPGCAARALPRHVRVHRCAAAAEAAGFRACHRCRPYRADVDPDLDAATAPLVGRAIEMIAAGAMDDAGEADLAAALGTSSRHLRRCLVAQVGTTPDQLARSRRAHLARRLLDDTDLPVSDVAFAAGFGSLRQFNRVMDAVFRGTPRELRARRRRTDRVVTDGGLALHLPPSPDFDHWLSTRRAAPGVEDVSGSGYRRIVDVHGDPGAVEVRRDGAGLVLVAHLPRLHGLAGVVHRVRRLLDGAAAWDAHEEAVWAAVDVGAGAHDAVGVVGRLVDAVGQRVPGLGAMHLHRCFPTASELRSGLDRIDLGLDAARSEAVRAHLAAVVGPGAPYRPVQ